MKSQLAKPLENIRYIVLLFVSRKPEKFAVQLKFLVTTMFTTLEFNVAFKTLSEICKFYPFKDVIKNKVDHSGVVYRINCTINLNFTGFGQNYAK